jgi:polysaccharide biosynthesis/export protein
MRHIAKILICIALLFCYNFNYAQVNTGGAGTSSGQGNGMIKSGTDMNSINGFTPNNSNVQDFLKDLNSQGANSNKVGVDNNKNQFTNQNTQAIKGGESDFQQRIKELREAGIPEDEIQKFINQQRNKGQNLTDVLKIKRDVSEEEAKKQQLKVLQGLPDYFGKNDSVNLAVYGGSIFSKTSIVFTPVENPIPPDDYKIGPGDIISVTIWGQAEFQNNYTVGKDGSIFPSNIGKIFLKGSNYRNAREIIIGKFSSVTPPGSNIEIAISDVRTIRVNVIGEVNQPGAYSMSALNTAFNALYLAGGPNRLGSLREIYVKRNGKVIDTLDVYRYLQKGDKHDDIYLENNDFLFVNVYKKQVSIGGEIKRPLIYQLRDNETLKDLIDLAGGIKFDARLANIQLFRTENEKIKIYDINAYDIISGARKIELMDGDKVFIRAINDEITNKSQIIGEVAYPGVYELKQGQKVSDLITKAGGLKGEAYLQRAYIIRLTSSFEVQYIPINLSAVIKKDDSLLYEQNNLEIKQFDALKIFSVNDFQDVPYVSIDGLVRNPGTYILSGKRTLKDLLYISGGMKNEAEFNQVEVASIVSIEDAKRRNIPIKTIIKQYSIDPLLDIDTIAEKILLRPYDQIFVRKNPDFSFQKNVAIIGKVKYPGTYSLKEDKERISSLIRRAGGLLPVSNVKGATFKRANVGAVILIDLGKAIKRPGSKYDIILNESDELNIPELDEVVRITGDVQVPVNVFFDRDRSDFKYYISLAGGYGERPMRRKATVKYANGIVRKAHNYIFFNTYPKVDYGCTLSVPQRPERKILNIAASIPTALLQSLAYVSSSLGSGILIYYTVSKISTTK